MEGFWVKSTASAHPKATYLVRTEQTAGLFVLSLELSANSRCLHRAVAQCDSADLIRLLACAN